MNQLAEDLTAARALIERGWTRRALARDRWGHRVLGDDDRAVRFCPIGAITRVTVGGIAEWDARRALIPFLPPGIGIADFNDQSKKFEVLALFDRAIAAAEQA